MYCANEKDDNKILVFLEIVNVYKINLLVALLHFCNRLSTTEIENKLYTKSIEEMIIDYEDEKNSMIASPDKDNLDLYEEFYDEMDNRLIIEQSMNMIFFGPATSFMRLDPETILHILTHTKKQYIPIARVILVWDILTDGKTAAYLQGREYLALGSLLNVVPEQDLYYVNFGDVTVLRYFANSDTNLHKRKLGILVASYKRYHGHHWYRNSNLINELGYLLCGFPYYDLQKISPRIFTEININVLSKLERCSSNQTRTLYNIATHRDAYDEPYKWSSHEVTRLNLLFAYIPSEDISSITLEAIPAISTRVIKAMHQQKLEYFTKQQILRMNPKTRRIYILRMQLKISLDTSRISRRSALVNSPSYLLLLSVNIVTLIMK